MRTDRPTLGALLRPLRGYAERATERADAQTRAVGLTVEKLGHWRRCYRDPRFDSHADSAANTEATPTAGVGNLNSTPWSVPTLTTTAAAGWSR